MKLMSVEDDVLLAILGLENYYHYLGIASDVCTKSDGGFRKKNCCASDSSKEFT